MKKIKKLLIAEDSFRLGLVKRVKTSSYNRCTPNESKNIEHNKTPLAQTSDVLLKFKSFLSPTFSENKINPI